MEFKVVGYTGEAEVKAEAAVAALKWHLFPEVQEDEEERRRKKRLAAVIRWQDEKIRKEQEEILKRGHCPKCYRVNTTTGECGDPRWHKEEKVII